EPHSPAIRQRGLHIRQGVPRDATARMPIAILQTDFALPWHKCQNGGGAAMTFEEILDHAMAMLQRRGRVTYRTLKRQFNLDDEGLEDLKEALLYAHPHVADDPGHGLIWRGEPTSTPPPVPSAPQPAPRLAVQDVDPTPTELSPTDPRIPDA